MSVQINRNNVSTRPPPGTYLRRFWRYYLDKYLMLVVIFSVLSALSEMGAQPLLWRNVRDGVFYLVVAALCVLFSKHRLVLLGGILAVTALRGAIRFVLSQDHLALVIGLLAAAGVYVVVRYSPSDYHIDMPERYTWKEAVSDVVVFHVIVAIFVLMRF